MSKAWRRAVVAVLFLVPILLWGRDAAAHANLRSSVPSAGERLRGTPKSVTLEFTEAPELALSQVHVLDDRGGAVERGNPRTVSSNALSVEVEPLTRGVYTVSWRVVSSADGHATAGSFVFGVSVSPEGAAARSVSGATTVPPPLEVAGRWALIVGLVVTLGGAVATSFVLRGGSEAVRTYVLTGSFLALGGVFALAVAQGSAAGVGLSTLLRTAIGRALVWRAAAVIGAIAAVLVLPKANRIRFGAVAVFAAAAMGAEVTAGHAAAVGSFRWASIGAQWTHFAAVGVWMGGLGALLLGVRGEPSEAKAAAVRRFSTMAAVAIAVVAFTGTYRAVNQLGSLHAFYSSWYGRVVMIKDVLFFSLVALGARNRFVNVPAASRDLGGLRRVSRFELSIAAVVLAATAVLTGLSPPPPVARASESGLAAAGSDLGGTVKVLLFVVPGYAGNNAFVVRFEDAVPDTQRVAIRFELADGEGVGPSTLELKARSDDAWQAEGANLSIEGIWSLSVLVQGRTTSADVPLEIATRCRTEPVVAPGQPTIYDQQLGDGASAQMYVDPGEPGRNEVHFTFFDDEGEELRIRREPVIRAWHPGAEPKVLDVRRFSAGHFIASGKLEGERWRFDARVANELSACFEQEIG